MTMMIQTEHLAKHYNLGKQTVPIISDVNLPIETGEFVAIMGPSGCGKSSLLYLLGGLDQPTSGKGFIVGEVINHLNARVKGGLRGRELGWGFKFYNLVKI